MKSNLVILDGDKRLSVSKKKFRATNCNHNDILIDEDGGGVECGTCGISLDAFAVLLRFAKEESKLQFLRRENKKELKEMRDRQKVKCIHCGRFTKL